jgi:hypothetical protein
MSDVTQLPFAGLFWAERPRPECTDQLAAFAPLIGSWDLRVTNYREDGTSATVDGEWHFGWALDGRAVADVWIVPSRRSRPPKGDGEWGVTIRFFDPSIDAWRSTWHGPAHGSVLPFTARRIGDELVLEARFSEDVTTRWIFSEISSDSFRWRAEETPDAGPSFLKQEFAATRSG